MSHPSGGEKPQQAQKRAPIPFGKYLLLERIAVGGMAEVFLAKSFGIEGFEKIIAIKRILPTMAEDEDFIEMFIDEAKIAGHLNHANIVPIYELGKIGDSHYIAMEYVWGKDLLQIMNRFRRMRRRMPPAMVAFVASKMCEALEYAHTKRDRKGEPLNLIHRDISPQNILVSYEGGVKLIDFGIAKAASRTTKTQAGVLKGKFGYMSPEQVRGLPIDFRSDVFAVGTCMYEMLTSERLFMGESDFSTLEKVRHAAVSAPSEMVQGVPPDFDKIVMKALAREPADRWQTAGELQEALQEFLATQRPPFTTSKLAAWMRSAFSTESETEKARLDGYAQIGRPSVLGAGAHKKPPVPPPRPHAPSQPKAADDVDDSPLEGEATMISTSPFEELDEASPPATPPDLDDDVDEMQEEATQIFFSNDDLEELIVPEDQPSVGAPHAGGPSPAVLAAPSIQLGGGGPPAPMGGAFGQAGPPSGAFPQPSQPPAGMQPGYTGMDASGGFQGPPGQAPLGQQRGLATVEMQALQLKESRMDRRTMAIIGAIAAVLLIVGVVAAVALSGPGTGHIEVRTIPDVHADVLIDDVLRGRAPLRISSIEEGVRKVTITAPNYQTVERQVHVGAEATTMLDVVLVATSGESSSSTMMPQASASMASEMAASMEASMAEEPTSEMDGPEIVARNDPPEAEEEPEPPVMRAAPREASPRVARNEAPMRTAPRVAEMTAPRRGGGTAPAGGAAAAMGGRGTLVINTIPWARIYVDGRNTGQTTPAMNLRVPAGRHRIGLQTNDGQMHNVTVNVPANETVRIMRRLQ